MQQTLNYERERNNFMKKPLAFAVANNDYVHVAWDFGSKLDNCDGFAVYRIEKNGDPKGKPLPVFGRDAQGNRLKISCEDQPIRKYNWRDVFERRDQSYKYRVVAMIGPKQPLPGVDEAESDWIEVTSKFGKAQVYFNRGILATQRVADIIWNPTKEKPDFAKIERMISDPESELRKSLSGQLFGALTNLLDRAKVEGGSCWASLYELTDPVLIERLAECDDLHLILSNNNTAKTKTQPEVYDGKNQPAAKKLENAKELIRRYMPTGQIGHNKFIVYVDKNKKARAVLTGSTNWTPSGLCTQSNNAILIESPELAEVFLSYWQDLKNDAEEAGIPKKPAKMSKIQGKALRGKCEEPRKTFKLNGDSTVTVWYSPNAPSLLRSVKKGAKPPATPIDMTRVYHILKAAKQSVLFLAFMPGKASSEGSFHFLKELANVATEKPGLFVRGAVSDPDLTKEFDLKILSSGANEDSMISSPQGIFKNFEKWRTEIYKYGHAIIHDKTIVVDPFSKDCVVITGSHNLGFRASSNNDENMLIIRGDRQVAQAYAAHVMDIFEHYRSRWITYNKKSKDYDPRKDAKWQDRYFDSWRPAFAERLFWVADGKPIPELVDNPLLKKAAAKLEKDAAAKQKAAAERKAAKAAAKGSKSSKQASKKKATKKAAAKKAVKKKGKTTAAKKKRAKKSAKKKATKK
jgi:phosphatidylserine/phosphatidylglycerophosphate/cardiolipin synthase-like enzyme